jgi:PEP-CTERM motif
MLVPANNKTGRVMKLNMVVIALLAAFASLPAAAAEYLVDFSGSGVDAEILVSTSATANSDGSFTIGAVSGERNGLAITGLLPAGNNPSTCGAPFPCWILTSDNEFFPTAPFVDFGGFSYTIGGGYGVPGGEDVNLYYQSSNNTYYDLTETLNAANCDGLSTCSYRGTPVRLSVTQVPEPAALGLFAASLAGLAWVRRRRLSVRC